jgi:hypothetical protein
MLLKLASEPFSEYFSRVMKIGCFLIIIFILTFTIGCKKEYSGWNVYYNSKIDLEEIIANEGCPAGGVLIRSGLDKNQNDILDSAEVDQVEMICNGKAGSESEPGPVTGTNQDKQIIIQLDMLTANMSSTAPLILGELPFFSKNNYPGVDSIVLVGRPYIWPGNNSTGYIELYNLTDNQPIANSSLIASKEYDQAGFITSANCYSAMPDKQFSLGLRLYSSQNGMPFGTGPLYLYLYRK